MFDPVALLDRAPEGVRRLAYRTAAGRGMLGRVADVVRFRFSKDEVPTLPQPSDKKVRLLIGPANSAGQGFQWARAAEHYLSVAAISVRELASGSFMPDTDLRVPVGVYQRSSAWHSSFETYLENQTHVIWESGLPLLGREYGTVTKEFEVLRHHGVRGALMFHGSDIRPPSLHSETSDWSPFRDPSPLVRVLEDRASNNAELAKRTGAPVFVSTPDLLRWVPNATWCPVVIDAGKWLEPLSTRTSRVPPVVAHAPSQRWLKGTDRIEPMLHRLTDEGVIEYRQVVGVPHASMPKFYADADIILDQFVLGIYGVAACEAMASGRLVMSHVDDFTRAQVRERTGFELPIHEATIASLESQLRLAASEPATFDAIRAAGPPFVQAVHNGRRSAETLAPFLGLDQ